MPNEPPRLFLSYSVLDASELAERLRRDLAARGYQVWQDVNRIRAGRFWDEEVQTGLRNSQVLLALLSPLSVRRARDPENPTATDSVCLDEIEYAQHTLKIPIVPVRVVSCEAPFLICRLHQIDFLRWCESEAAYQEGVIHICAGIEAALENKTPKRPLIPSLEPWDFAPFLFEKRNRFTGRQWLFRNLDKWRSKEAPPALLIIGEPGIGKSAIVATLVHENPESQVLAYHCCRADTPATLEPARFVRSLAGMLAARLEGYSAMLKHAGIRSALERADSDPASAFEAAVLSPLHNIPRTVGDRRYLLIDALDEALMYSKRPTIVEVLAARMNRLPSWLGIVATTRNEPGVLRQLRGLPAQALKADDPKNEGDVLVFLQCRLSESGLRDKVEASGKTLNDVALGVLRSSAGNFLFVTAAIDAIEDGQLRLEDLEGQPPGRLSSLYEVFFNRLFRDAGIDFRSAGRVLEVISAAREPLSRNQIAAVIGLDAEEELPSLDRLAAFVPVREGRYALFHRSLYEWLTGWDTQQDQTLAGHYHLSLREGHKRLADRGWAEYERGVLNTSPYFLRHLVAHLHEAGRNGQARTLLLDFDWLQAKLKASDVNALIADYDYLPEDKDLQLVQSAIRLSAHALTHHKGQLAGQLTGRLIGNPAACTQQLLKQAAERKPAPWLRPMSCSLIAAGGSLIRSRFTGHLQRVRTVAVTPDGTRAVSGSDDKTLRVWDLETGKSLCEFKGHTGEVMAVAVTSDGRRVVSGSLDRTLLVWELESGETVHKLEGHSHSVRAVAVNPNGLAVSGSWDGTLLVWDLKSGKMLSILGSHTHWINSIALTSDGTRAVSASNDRTLRVWDLEHGGILCELGGKEGHKDWVSSVAVTPDGSRAISGSHDKTLGVWDLKEGRRLRELKGHTGEVWAVAVTPDGRTAISGSDDKTLLLWNLESDEPIQALGGQTHPVRAVAVTQNARAVSASGDTLWLWNLKSQQTICGNDCHRDEVSSIAVTPGGLAVSASHDKTLRVWDLEGGKLIRTLDDHSDSVTAVAAACEIVVSASEDKTLRLWDLKSGKPIDEPLEACTLEYQYPDLSPEYQSVRVWLTEDNETVHTPDGQSDWVNSVAVTPDGCLAVSASGHQIRLWDLVNRKAIRPIEGHSDVIYSVALTSDGRRAISASRDRLLLLWDLENGKAILPRFEGHTDAVRAVAVTPDGRFAVSGSLDRTLLHWDLKSGLLWNLERDGPGAKGKEGARKPIGPLEGHTDAVYCVALTPDGDFAVSGSRDGTIILWDLKTRKEKATFTGEGEITDCGVTADGRTIIAGDSSGRVHFLRVVEADKTKPSPSDIKISLLLHQQQSTDKSKEPSVVLPTNARDVFISYAHADNRSSDPWRRWLDRFIEFLQPLVSQENFTLCSDQDIKIGDQWHGRIQVQLNAARAVVLLVSPAFLASDYIRNSELPVILKNAADRGVRIFPILISPSLFARAKYKYPDPKSGPEEFTLASLQAANASSKTLVEMTEGEQNRVLLEVAEQLADLLNENPQ
jgi:WD40 repeat protein